MNITYCMTDDSDSQWVLHKHKQKHRFALSSRQYMNGFRTTRVRKATRLVRNDGFGRISPS